MCIYIYIYIYIYMYTLMLICHPGLEEEPIEFPPR